MSNHALAPLALALALASPELFAQPNEALKITRLGDHLYKFASMEGGYETKIIASIGKDGVLLVDTGDKEWSKELLAKLKELGGGAPRIIINTHSHIEHISGNIPLSKGALVIGHENLRTRMQSHFFLWEGFPPEALPSLTFRDSMSLHFNGEEIRLLAFPGAHDNSDIVVWFTQSKLACVGALVNGHHFPSVDGLMGDVTKYPEVTAKVLAALPEDVKLVPGHGEECSHADGMAFQEMLSQTLALARSEMAKGKDLKTLQAENILAPWKTWEIAYIGVNGWLSALARGIQGAKLKPPIFAPLYYAYKEKGAEGAVQRYREIKATRAEAYRWEDMAMQLGRIAMKLQEDGKHADAIPFLELCLTEFPKDPSASMAHTCLGDAHQALQRKDKALHHFQKALELDSRNEDAKSKLEALAKK